MLRTLSAFFCLLAGASLIFAAEPPGDKTVRDFNFKKTKQGDLSIHVHYPPDWKKEDQRPAIVFFSGGGWKTNSVTQFEVQANHFAGRGMVAALADYRVKSRHQVTPEACVEDAKSAVRWLRQNAATLGVNPQRIVAAGGSAGGHIAACTALTEGLEAEGEDLKISSKPNVLVLFNPVLRFHEAADLMKILGKNDEALAMQISPTLHLSKETPPAILFYGKEDPYLKQGEEFMARSKEVGHRAEISLADGVGHSFFNKSPWKERTLQRADKFLTGLGYLKEMAKGKTP